MRHHICYVYVKGSLNTFCDAQSCRKETDEQEKRPKSSRFMKRNLSETEQLDLRVLFTSFQQLYLHTVTLNTSSVVSRGNAAFSRSLNEAARINLLFTANGVKHSRCFQMGCVRNNIPRLLNDLKIYV